MGLAVLGALAIAPAAWAGCGDGVLKAPASWQAAPRDAANPLLIRVADLPAHAPSIVGMWSVTFTAGGNMIDFGYAVWHADGTEFMNSGGRAPATQNFCLGVWNQTSLLGYRLNHYALSYDQVTGALNAKVNIKENVVLDPRGNSFGGTFTIDAYDPKNGTLLQHVGGTITGQRVTVN